MLVVEVPCSYMLKFSNNFSLISTNCRPFMFFLKKEKRLHFLSHISLASLLSLFIVGFTSFLFLFLFLFL